LSDVKYCLGIDVGSISVNVIVLDDDKKVVYETYTRTKGHPIQVTLAETRKVLERFAPDQINLVAMTGSAAERIAQCLGARFVNEIVAQARAVAHFHPEVKTVIEVGGQDSKLIILRKSASGKIEIEDFAMNTECAAGTGSFLDQQAERLGLDIEGEFGALAMECKTPPRIAGRCTVFAKSDMIHLQQLAAPVQDIVAGLCFAMARNFKGNIGAGDTFARPIAFQGGVAANQGLVRAFTEVLGLAPRELIIPRHFTSMGAIGAVLTALDEGAATGFEGLDRLVQYAEEERCVGKTVAPLRFAGDPATRHYIPSRSVERGPSRPNERGLIPAYVGIDVGSISTNVAVLDANGNLLAKSYLMTAGRPLEAVKAGLREVAPFVADKVEVLGVATTGSGRYLTGDFVGADVVRNEITAQARGSVHFAPDVDTIFEIGGQDSKYISLENGVVVDFNMNYACAAGTGSFLEEQADRLGISIKGEFAKLALDCKNPVRLGERCTVFMESDLVHQQQLGADVGQLVGGLAYSIVQNYLNRVVGKRRIGRNVFFQGGTAANRAVVAAFEAVTGKEMIVPEHHDVTGAIGAALLAQEAAAPGVASRFKGFDLVDRAYTQKSFECKHCPNHCEINEVIIEGESPLFYGSRCDRYNVKKEKKGLSDDAPDLFKEREAHFTATYEPSRPPTKGTIGIPRALFFYEQYPLWQAFFKELGYDVLFSPQTMGQIVRTGVELVGSQTCFPVKVMHGHIKWLLDNGSDTIFLPSVINLERDIEDQSINYLCPYVQTIPYQILATLDLPEHVRLLHPYLHFQRGPKVVEKELYALCDDLDCSKAEVRRALERAFDFQRAFTQWCRQRGREFLANIKEGERVAVLISRPYNGFDRGINLDLPGKLRTLGVQTVPIDFLPISGGKLGADWDNMFWKYGQRIIRAAQIIASDARLNAIYMSNFSCGPDSFIVSFFRQVMGDKPFLLLEIDEHSAGAGIITRLEAFLDSLDNASTKQYKAGERIFSVAVTDGAGHTVWIPHMCEHAHAFASAFRSCGMKAEVLPVSDDESLELGRRYTSGRECLPAIVTSGDMLKKIAEPGFDPARNAFFMPGGSGPCRFGHYHKLHQLILKEVGYPDIPVLSPNQGKGLYRDFAKLKKDPTRIAWQALVAVDVLSKAQLRYRPYETVPGGVDEVFSGCLDRLCRTIEGRNGTVSEALALAARDFREVPVDVSRRKPVIGIVGEIYVRSHPFSNNYLIDMLESLGAETELAMFCEWIYYTNFTRVGHYRADGNRMDIIKDTIKERVQLYDEHRLARAFRGILDHNLIEPRTRSLLDIGNRYIHETFEGEAILSVAKAVELIHQGASGIVNVMPFTCMPGAIVSAILKRVRKDYDNIPIVSIAYDGTSNQNLKTRLEAFIHQAKDYMISHRHEG